LFAADRLNVISDREIALLKQEIFFVPPARGFRRKHDAPLATEAEFLLPRAFWKRQLT